jgi:hypothetical protein
MWFDGRRNVEVKKSARDKPSFAPEPIRAHRQVRRETSPDAPRTQVPTFDVFAVEKRTQHPLIHFKPPRQDPCTIRAHMFDLCRSKGVKTD